MDGKKMVFNEGIVEKIVGGLMERVEVEEGGEEGIMD